MARHLSIESEHLSIESEMSRPRHDSLQTQARCTQSLDDSDKLL